MTTIRDFIQKEELSASGTSEGARKGWDEKGRKESYEAGDKVKIHPRLGGGIGVVDHSSPSGKFSVVKTKGQTRSFDNSDLRLHQPKKDDWEPKTDEWEHPKPATWD
jgi:hypothetical protein